MYPTDRAMTWIPTSEQPLWLILYYIIYYYLVQDFCNRCVIIYSSLPEYLAPYQHPPLPLAPGGGGLPSSLLKKGQIQLFFGQGRPPPPQIRHWSLSYPMFRLSHVTTKNIMIVLLIKSITKKKKTYKTTTTLTLTLTLTLNSPYADLVLIVCKYIIQIYDLYI